MQVLDKPKVINTANHNLYNTPMLNQCKAVLLADVCQ